MSNRNKLFELIKEKKEFTTDELFKESTIAPDTIWQYIHQFLLEGKIEAIGKKGRYTIYSIKIKNNKNNDEAVNLLNFLNTFFKDNVNHLIKSQKIKNFILKNEDKFTKIEEIING